MSILSRTNARRLDQRVTFQSKVLGAQDPNTGEQTFTWTNVAAIGENGTIWACVDAVKAAERYLAQQELAGNEYTVWVRWRGDLSPDMRIVWNGVNLNITGIPDNQRRGRYLSIFCQSGINSG